MCKRLVVVTLLVMVGVAWCQVPGNGIQQEKNAQEQKKSAALPKPVVAVETQSGANEQEQSPEKPPQYPWRELFAPANMPNWFLMIIAGVTGWFVYKTLKAIKKQADIMEAQAKDARESGAEATRIALATAQAARNAADAAEISAKAAMGISIPTLAVYKFAFVAPPSGDRIEFYRKPSIHLELKNYGQSPAFLKEFSVSFSWGTGHSDQGSYSFDPEQVIDAGATFTFGRLELAILNGPATDEEVWILAGGSQILVFAGWVTYKDVFGSIRRKLEFEKHLVEFDPAPGKMMVVDSSLIRNPLGDPNKD